MYGYYTRKIEPEYTSVSSFLKYQYRFFSSVRQQVETSCGCGVPKWTRKPIKPNKSGEIEVTYDAKYPGKFHKTITVFANTDDSPVQLTISGEVEYDKALITQQ